MRTFTIAVIAAALAVSATQAQDAAIATDPVWKCVQKQAWFLSVYPGNADELGAVAYGKCHMLHAKVGDELALTHSEDETRTILKEQQTALISKASALIKDRQN